MKKKLYKLPKARFIQLDECILQDTNSIIRGKGRAITDPDDDTTSPTGVDNGYGGFDF